LDYPKDNIPISKSAMTSKHDVRFLGRLAIDKIRNVVTTNKKSKGSTTRNFKNKVV
jgi:hypothetical protein